MSGYLPDSEPSSPSPGLIERKLHFIEDTIVDFGDAALARKPPLDFSDPEIQFKVKRADRLASRLHAFLAKSDARDKTARLCAYIARGLMGLISYMLEHKYDVYVSHWVSVASLKEWHGKMKNVKGVISDTRRTMRWLKEINVIQSVGKAVDKLVIWEEIKPSFADSNASAGGLVARSPVAITVTNTNKLETSKSDSTDKSRHTNTSLGSEDHDSGGSLPTRESTASKQVDNDRSENNNFQTAINDNVNFELPNLVVIASDITDTGESGDTAIEETTDNVDFQYQAKNLTWRLDYSEILNVISKSLLGMFFVFDHIAWLSKVKLFTSIDSRFAIKRAVKFAAFSNAVQTVYQANLIRQYASESLKLRSLKPEELGAYWRKNVVNKLKKLAMKRAIHQDSYSTAGVLSTRVESLANLSDTHDIITSSAVKSNTLMNFGRAASVILGRGNENEVRRAAREEYRLRVLSRQSSEMSGDPDYGPGPGPAAVTSRSVTGESCNSRNFGTNSTAYLSNYSNNYNSSQAQAVNEVHNNLKDALVMAFRSLLMALQGFHNSEVYMLHDFPVGIFGVVTSIIDCRKQWRATKG